MATDLVDNQGWRYDAGRGRGGHPMLFPADPTQPPLALPTTPGDRRTLANVIAQVRRRGGRWRTR